MLLTRASYSVNDGDLSREGIPFIDHFIRSLQLKVLDFWWVALIVGGDDTSYGMSDSTKCLFLNQFTH